MSSRYFALVIWIFVASLQAAFVPGQGLDSPRFSHAGGTFIQPFEITITASPLDEIRYTTNGAVPALDSFLYSGPILVEETIRIRAKAFRSGTTNSSDIVAEHYVRVDETVAKFTSDLPVFILENFKGGSITTTLKPAYIALFEPNGPGGRTSLTNRPTIQSRIGLKIRGSSTESQPKNNYGIETWNEVNDDIDIAPLGMPADSDWILYAPYNFDRALMRNPFMYELSNQMGRYAVRTRFVEVFVNTGGGPVSYLDYRGVYVLMEKVKRGDDRIDVEKLLPEYNTEPLITGGYMLKIDRLDPGDRGVSAAGQTLGFVYPEEKETSREQYNWIRNYLSAFGTALNGASFTNSETGYAKYIDVDAFIDHHILNEFSKNPDGLRLSTYMYKKRGGKLTKGPIWDFDRTLGPDDDDRAASPSGWSGSFTYGWYSRLFRDPDFYQRYIDRWHQFRQKEMTVTNMNAIIDRMVEVVSEAQARNFEKWKLVTLPNGWRTEVNQLKSWISRRVTWMDSQFAPAPTLSHSGGLIPRGFQLAIIPATNTVYYTLDGSDPRLPGGAISPKAQIYRADSPPIILNETTHVMARTRISRTREPWSGLVSAIFTVDSLPQLAITEIMYHPPVAPQGSTYDKDDFEYIELQNLGAESVKLTGMSLREGVQFVFPKMDLGPGDVVLVVKNRGAFLSRYPGSETSVAGEYDGNLNNAGESIALHDASGREILRVTYDDGNGWSSDADGSGRSLELLQPHIDYSRAPSWRSSMEMSGSPGRSMFTRLDLISAAQHASSSQPKLRFKAEANRSYTIYYKDHVSDQTWKVLQTVPANPLETLQEISDPTGANALQRFYRVTSP